MKTMLIQNNVKNNQNIIKCLDAQKPSFNNGHFFFYKVDFFGERNVSIG